MSSLVVTIPTLGKLRINFYGIDEEILIYFEKENESRRLKKIKHLGLISDAFGGATHSRYEYLLLECGITEIIEQMHKGYRNIALGDITLNGRNHHGNSVLKSWFLLSNHGHMRNTFADEKVILYHINSKRSVRDQFLNKIRDRDLRIWSNKIIENFNYRKFYHVLSLYKICEFLKHTQTKTKFIEIYKLLLLDKLQEVDQTKIQQLKNIYNIIRKIAIITIDSYYSHIPLNFNITSAIYALTESELFFSNASINENLDPILKWIADEIYLDEKVAEIERSYELESLADISIYNNEYQLITSANEMGLSADSKSELTCIIKTKIPEAYRRNQVIVKDQRLLQRRLKDLKSINVYIDENPINSERYLYIFHRKGEFSKRELATTIYRLCLDIEDRFFKHVKSRFPHIFGILDKVEDYEDSIDKDILEELKRIIRHEIAVQLDDMFKEEILPIFRSFFWSILKILFKENYAIDIINPRTVVNNFGAYFPNKNLDLITNSLCSQKSECDAPDRFHELRQLEHSIIRKYDDFIFACFERIMVLDTYAPPSKRVVTDIDGVIIRLKKDKLVIELHEAKNKGSNVRSVNSGKSDLRKYLIPCLNNTIIKGYRTKPVRWYGAKLVLSFPYA